MTTKVNLRNLAKLTNPVTRAKEAFKLGGSIGGLGSSASGLSLMRINVITQGDAVVRALNALGFNYAAEDIMSKLDKRSAKILNALADAALSAFKSKVPIRSGTLRNKHIKVTGDPYTGPNTPGRFKSGSSSTLSRDIYVDNSIHLPPYPNQRLTASSLADFKDTVGQRRSRDSFAEGGFTSESKGSLSKNWISNAEREFNQKKLSIIKQVKV